MSIDEIVLNFKPKKFLAPRWSEKERAKVNEGKCPLCWDYFPKNDVLGEISGKYIDLVFVKPKYPHMITQIMIQTKEHYPDLLSLNSAEFEELFQTLWALLDNHLYIVGNFGLSTSQSVNHIHFHIYPKPTDAIIVNNFKFCKDNKNKKPLIDILNYIYDVLPNTIEGFEKIYLIKDSSKMVAYRIKLENLNKEKFANLLVSFASVYKTIDVILENMLEFWKTDEYDEETLKKRINTIKEELEKRPFQYQVIMYKDNDIPYLIVVPRFPIDAIKRYGPIELVYNSILQRTLVGKKAEKFRIEFNQFANELFKRVIKNYYENVK